MKHDIGEKGFVSQSSLGSQSEGLTHESVGLSFWETQNSGQHFYSEFSAHSARDNRMQEDDLNRLSSMIIKATMNVHKELGPGLMESVYSTCMQIELGSMDIKVRNEVALPVIYRGRKVSEEGFRLDLLVDDRIIVELKSVDRIQDIHKKQLLTYLRLANKPLGLLINFNEPLLKDGITRIINSPRSAEVLA